MIGIFTLGLVFLEFFVLITIYILADEATIFYAVFDCIRLIVYSICKRQY
jgi:hypothetical protein